jgi:predicted pyridoxine 5'-phosphate oxidase superfamily flavin-nucleotide-binding protein
MTDNTAHALALLTDNSYAVLATADSDGNPRATPVWFAPDGLDRLPHLVGPGPGDGLMQVKVLF